MIGMLSERNDTSLAALKEAIAHGIVAASFNVEDFSLHRMTCIGRSELDTRMQEYRAMLNLQ